MLNIIRWNVKYGRGRIGVGRRVRMFASYLKIVCIILNDFRSLKEHLFINFADYLGVFGLNLGGFVDS